MRTVHHEGGLKKSQLVAIAEGRTAISIDDMEFLETLAQNRCMVMPPWVYHIRTNGKLERLTPVRYQRDYNLDKATMLLAVMRKLPREW